MIKGLFWVLVLALFLIACGPGTNTNSPATAKSVKENNTPSNIELAVYMTRLQRYLEKAYWSANANNTALHEFYIHEMEETMEQVQEAGLVEDGVNISYNMLQFGIKSLETYEARVKEDGIASVPDHFQNLINGCNGCHLTSKKGFIQIQVPTVNQYNSQKFTP